MSRMDLGSPYKNLSMTMTNPALRKSGTYSLPPRLRGMHMRSSLPGNLAEDH